MTKKAKKTKEEKETIALAEQIDQLTKEKEELFEKLQRLSADYANFQKRAPKQIADSVAYQKEAIIKSFLPCMDNLEHALAGAADAETVESVTKGIQIVFEHMQEALKSHGLERIDSLGAEFDPAIHEAMMRRVEEDKADNIVLEEFQPGYKLAGRVIRPSKVIVNKLPVVDEPDEPETDEEAQQTDTESEDQEQ